MHELRQVALTQEVTVHVCTVHLALFSRHAVIRQDTLYMYMSDICVYCIFFRYRNIFIIFFSTNTFEGIDNVDLVLQNAAEGRSRSNNHMHVLYMYTNTS